MSDSYNQDSSITQVDRDNTMTSGGGYGNTQTGAGYGANNRAGASNQDLDNFETFGRTGGMDYNSGPGNTGGGFDAGSGAEGYGTSGNTGGNFGTSGMDQNSGARNTGGGFDTGSGAGAGAALGRTGGKIAIRETVAEGLILVVGPQAQGQARTATGLATQPLLRTNMARGINTALDPL
ncbi:hypothetical protein DFH09DRAFT_1331338 [Mycena vulgaris]|nr:hypothetical protein DFH09DRAFT_1331338 [Mycena vulgaris]